MQFVYPQMLWALFLLLIPLIIHLFQLRKFHKEAFTNVALLEKIDIQTRKSARLKKWLVFISRMLAATAIIIAFAQPYYARNTLPDTKKELVIYLDNSFSMQAGDLLKKAVQDMVENIPETLPFTLFTNDKLFKNTTIKTIKNELLALNYSPAALTITGALVKGKSLFTDPHSSGHTLVLISDFQEKNAGLEMESDSLLTLNPVKLSPQNPRNIGIDSLYISGKTPQSLTLTVDLSRQENAEGSVPVSLFDRETLIAKAPATFNNSRKARVTFDIPSGTLVRGKVAIEEEGGLLFDNTLHFTVNQPEKIAVLAINEADDDFLKRIYTGEEFSLTSVTITALDYNLIDRQHLIILNELQQIPQALVTTLQTFKNTGGSLIVIPSEEIVPSSYTPLLRYFNAGTFSNLISQEKKIIGIAYSHPVFKHVFEKQIQNFQYPQIKSFYRLAGNASTVLQLENNDPFLAENNNMYVFTAALNSRNSNFKDSPLIVPTFYSIAKNSLQLPQLYYTLGRQNRFELKTRLRKDAILSLANAHTSFIPQQQAFDNKVQIITYENPAEAGTYTVISGKDSLSPVSFNYDRSESLLRYHSLDTLKNITSYTALPRLFNDIKNESNSTALWKWFTIFAVVFLITELMLLKFLK